MMIVNDFSALDERYRGRFEQLNEMLFRRHLRGICEEFRVFETRRSRARQLEMVKRGVSKVTVGAHIYGLAADFVPWVNGRWSWDHGHNWAELRACASLCGLVVPIKWDLCHVEVPHWRNLRQRAATLHPTGAPAGGVDDAPISIMDRLGLSDASESQGGGTGEEPPEGPMLIGGSCGH